MKSPIVPAALLLMQLAPLTVGAAATDGDADPARVDRGRYLATAGDCAGCHGESLAGGEPVQSPIGPIYASNVTPDARTGIGDWTLAQFSDALRAGRSPDGHLYPAMPYTSYTGLGDDDIRAIYSWIMLEVEPVSYRPLETEVPFPFVRPAMAAWNALFLDEGRATGAIDVDGERERRGRLLVESLGHCTACHTPRGQLMQPDGDRHLGGAMIGGWWAPDITSRADGIGGWSDERLASFLMTGHTDVAVAAGEMGTVVSRSLSKLTKDDIDAVVAYLRAVPPVASDAPRDAPSADAGAAVRVAAIEPMGPKGGPAMLDHDTVQGDRLYQSACASCHGVDGAGSTGLTRPSLHRVEGVAAAQGATLVQVIAHGVDRAVGDDHALMPPFRNDLDDAQIASLANYVRSDLGGIESDLDAQRVVAILTGEVDTPWLIRNAHWLAIAGIVAAALALPGIGRAIWWARERRRPRHA